MKKEGALCQHMQGNHKSIYANLNCHVRIAFFSINLKLRYQCS